MVRTRGITPLPLYFLSSLPHNLATFILVSIANAKIKNNNAGVHEAAAASIFEFPAPSLDTFMSERKGDP